MRDQNHIIHQSNGCHEQISIFYELTNRSQISKSLPPYPERTGRT